MACWIYLNIIIIIIIIIIIPTTKWPPDGYEHSSRPNNKEATICNRRAMTPDVLCTSDQRQLIRLSVIKKYSYKKKPPDILR